jgi:hypothetical protein
MIWKVNTLKEAVALFLYKSKLSALHDNDLIYLRPDWLTPTLLGAAASNSYHLTASSYTAVLIGETPLRRSETKGDCDCHIIWYIEF